LAPGFDGYGQEGLAAASHGPVAEALAASAAQFSHKAAGIRPFMHRLSVGEQEQLLQLESVAKASWFGHDPGDGDPSPCDDRLFAGLNLGQHGRKPGLCGSHADSLYQGGLKSWSDDQDKHRLALLIPRRRAEQRPLLPAGTDPHNSAMQHYPGISRPCLVPYPRHQNPAAPERRPPGGMR